ncbi:MAG TPA: hypothetical protein VGF06_14560 [Terriglobales bacterium]
MTLYFFLALTAALAVGIPLYMFWPSPVEHGEVKTRLAYLRERKDVVYDNMRDLNFEYKAGKLSEADYDSLKANMEEEAAALLGEIARLEAPGAAYSPKGARA